VFLLDSLLIDGLKFVMDKLVQVVDTELNDDTALRERLLNAQMRLEDGDLSMEEFGEIERDVFARLRELKGGHTAPLSMTSDEGSVSVEASVADEVDDK
jgi:gas vesicle protein GvpG